MSKVLVVADDITGADDIGLMYYKSGHESVVFPYSSWMEASFDFSDKVVIDTDSRLVSRKEAYQRVFNVVKKYSNDDISLYFDKQCSVFRGNIGAEFDAMLDALNADFAPVVLGFPDNGRTTVDGVHYVHGTKLEESQFRYDPMNPMTKSNLVDILSEQTSRRVSLISYHEYLDGFSRLEAVFEKEKARGGYVIFDVRDNEDLKSLSLLLKNERIICGSSAIAYYLGLLEPAAEVLEVELAYAAQAVAHRHLVVVLQVFVHLFYIVFFGEGVRDASFQRGLVRRGVEDDGVGLLPVAAGASRFLEVGLDRVRQVHVYHQAYVRLVDAHAEGVCGHDDAAFALLPAVLAQVLGGVVQSGVVVVGREALGGQPFGYLFGAASVAHIDDGASGDTAEDVQQFARLVFRPSDHIGQVLSLEAHAEHILVGEAEACLNVLHHFGRGGGRQGQYGYAGQEVADFGNLQVGGPEVIAPLRDAVALVHGNHRDVHPAELGAEDVRVQPLGRDVEELVVAEDGVLQRGDNLLPVHAGMDAKGADAPVLEVLHLVLHQGDEGRHHQA